MMRKIWKTAGLFVALALPAAAAPIYYVQSIANATTSGNIPNGQSFSSDTGQVQALSNSAGPFTANSGGTFYSFSSSAGVVTEIGVQHAFATATASSTGPAGGASANAQGQWSDTVTITSDTLPVGTLVSFLATIILDRTISGALPASASVDVTGPLGLHLTDTLSSPNPTQSVSTVVNTTIGSVLSLTSTLSLNVGASGIAPFNLAASALAQNTSVFVFEPITPGASYATASGAVFTAVPEPAVGLGVLCGLIVLGIRRARLR